MDKRTLEITIHAVILITLFIISIIIPFKNPDMTQTRLLLEYWWFYIPALILMIISSFRINTL